MFVSYYENLVGYRVKLIGFKIEDCKYEFLIWEIIVYKEKEF